MKTKPCVKCGNPIFKKNKACPKCRKTQLIWLDDMECYIKHSPYKTTTAKKKAPTPKTEKVNNWVAALAIIFTIAIFVWFYIYYWTH